MILKPVTWCYFVNGGVDGFYICSLVDLVISTTVYRLLKSMSNVSYKRKKEIIKSKVWGNTFSLWSERSIVYDQLLILPYMINQ